MLGKPGQPGCAAVGQAPAKERTELFAAMLEEFADKALDFRGKSKRRRFAHQVQ
jgi:hypothetical protein